MKRYLAFAGAEYYPSGGWEDFVGDYDTIEAAQAAADAADTYASQATKWTHVVDLETGQTVEAP